MDLKALLKAQADTSAKIDALLAQAQLSDDDRKQLAALEAEYTQFADRIAAARRQEQRAEERRALESIVANEEAKRQAEERRTERQVGSGRITGREPATATANRVERTDDEGRVTSFFEDTDETVTLRVGDSRDAQRRQSYRQQNRHNRQQLKSAGYVPWGTFKNFAEFAREGLSSHQHSSFRDKVGKHYNAVLGMNEGQGSDGGYTVMPEFSSTFLDRVYMNSLWSRTDSYNVNGNNLTFMANAETSRANGSRHGGMRGYWIGEGGTFTASKPTLREVTLKLGKLGIVVYLTNELIEDTGTALQEYVARKAGEEFEFIMGDSLINGLGGFQPLGVLNAPSLISIAKETTQAGATLQIENIDKMYQRFFMPNLGGAYWYHNQDILSQLNQMTLGIGTAGVPVFLPPGGISSAPYGSLRGRPLEPTEFNATLGTQGDLILADLGQMLSITKGGVMQAVSIHVQFLTDQLALRFIIRLNARPWEAAAITPYKGTSNTQSSFVTCDTRA